MCRQQVSAYAVGAANTAKENVDEVWETISSDDGSDDSGSECDSEPESDIQKQQRLHKQLDKQAAARQPQQQAGYPLPGRASGAVARDPVVPAVSTATAAQQQPMRPIQRHVVPPQSSGLMSLVGHLRSDNEKLREALVQAQREAESAMLAAEKGGYEGAGVDFGHLLSLVKDFGDGLGGGDFWDEQEEVPVAQGGQASPMSPTSAEVFSMDSPRDADDMNGDATTKALRENSLQPQVEQQEDVVTLRQELEASRKEAAELRALLAARDQELWKAHGGF